MTDVLRAEWLKLRSVPFVPLCVAVLGALTISSEFASGSIRTTVAAVSRQRVLLAKAIVVTCAAAVAGTAVVFASFVVGQAIVGEREIDGFTAPFSDELARLLGNSLTVVIAALVGLGLAALLRSAAGSVVGVVALLYVIPGLASVFPDPWADRVSSVMVMNLADQVAGEGAIPPIAGLAVAAGYVVVVGCAAAVTLQRRDL